MQKALGLLHSNGRLDENPAIVAPFNERQRLVKKALYDSLDEQYRDVD
jgi:hypothetical protein